MKCPHCRFEWEPRPAVRLARSFAGYGPILLAVLLCASFFTGVGLWVAYGETAVEIIPGVTHYGNHSTSVEIIPGHRQYVGEITGSVTEITPGIQHYQLDRQAPAAYLPSPGVSPLPTTSSPVSHPHLTPNR